MNKPTKHPRPLRSNDVTVLLILSDGSHRVTSWRGQPVEWKQIAKVFREQVESLLNQNQGVTITYATVADGREVHSYSALDCLDIAAQA